MSSNDAEARYVPSGLHAHDLTPAVWPSSTRTSLLPSAPRLSTRTVSSPEAEARRVPSGIQSAIARAHPTSVAAQHALPSRRVRHLNVARLY